MMVGMGSGAAEDDGEVVSGGAGGGVAGEGLGVDQAVEEIVAGMEADPFAVELRLSDAVTDEVAVGGLAAGE